LFSIDRVKSINFVPEMGSEAAKKIVFQFNGPLAQNIRKRMWMSFKGRPYGLLWYDTIREYLPEVDEAISRLPPHEYDARMERAFRASSLAMKNEILPKSQWTQWDDETWYLKPYLDEVRKEIYDTKRLTGKKPGWYYKIKSEMSH